MSNVDPAEVAKFEALAERWWDPEGEFRPLHRINPLRLDYIEQRAARGLRGRRVLDVGCGGGILAEAMAARGALVSAIDVAETPLEVARAHAQSAGAPVSYERARAEDFAREHAGEFDIVTCLEMLEHVPEPASSVRACAALAAAGGDLFFSTINRNPKSYLLAIVGAEYVLGLLPRGTHDYRKLIKPSELDRWARENALVLNHLIGLHYHPLSGRYRFGPGADVNYLAHYSRHDRS